MYSLKNGKALPKVIAKNIEHSTPNRGVYLLEGALDKSSNRSVLAIHYKTTTTIQTDTITLTYTRARYISKADSISGYGMYITDVKLEKSTAKPPITISIRE